MTRHEHAFVYCFCLEQTSMTLCFGRLGQSVGFCWSWSVESVLDCSHLEQTITCLCCVSLGQTRDCCVARVLNIRACVCVVLVLVCQDSATFDGDCFIL